ncbi:hypothetical protein [Salarchaeum japonicum]|uniref:hypothetical protein n=1 Tax=Salarchaeum japonicum TaxID=555573 RepID=UPI003C74B757
MGDRGSSDSEILLEELRRQSVEQKEQHQENIQILVALSLFAGYITAFFNNLFDNFALNIATTLLASIVFLFLLYKLILNSHVVNSELITSDRVDKLFSAFYLVSVVGFGLVAVFIVTAEQFDISIQSISSETVATIFSASIIPFMIALLTWLGWKKRQILHRQEDQLRERFPQALEMLDNGGIVNTQKKQVLIERLEALLDKDRQREPNLFWLASILMVSNADTLTALTADARLRLLNIIERIERRDKYGEYNEEDLRKIETILESAEESS